GLEVAYEYPVFTQYFGGSGKNLQVILSPVVDVYAYRGNHTGVSLNGDLSLRYATVNGFSYQAFGAYGVLGTVLAGEVYEASPNGGFESSRIKGDLYPQWKIGIGIGQKIANTPISLNLRLGVREARLPGGSPVPNTSIGINWFL
ncbi:MAG: hypothetical protein AAFQ87_26210, partial [Bacteroidota bacterium]